MDTNRLAMFRIRMAADATIAAARKEHGDDVADWLEANLHANLRDAISAEVVR